MPSWPTVRLPVWVTEPLMSFARRVPVLALVVADEFSNTWTVSESPTRNALLSAVRGRKLPSW
ncbi:hypothetical protein D3C71_1742640 [compost metagenome]